MRYNPDAHRRRSIRLRNFDYTTVGAYFVTVCTHNRVPLFGEIQGDEMWLNDAGQIVQDIWNGSPDQYSHVQLDAWVVMPNHVHGIITLVDPNDVGAGFKPAPTPPNEKRRPLSEIVRAFKTFSARRINEYRGTSGTTVWQRHYYEHVIRSETSLHDIRHYIVHNPAKWAEYNPTSQALGS
ncbi:MAG: transposase [Dehalococcoidia bacterium]|nr:transposase [Dehalococcoidia bacterium]